MFASPKLYLKFALKPIGLAMVAAIALSLPASAWAQGTPATHSRVTLDNGTTDTADDFLFFPFVGGDGATGLGLISNPNGASTWFSRADAPSGSISMTPNGVGIGLSGFDTAAPQNAQAALHVMGGGGAGPFQSQSAFPTAKVLIEDRGPNSFARELLRLQSDGGSRIRFDDTSTGGGQYSISNVIGLFEIANANPGKVNFRIRPNAPRDIFTLEGNGVGIGTQNPATTLHVLADGNTDLGTASIRAEVTNAFPTAERNLLQLRNNGAVNFDFLDTSTPTPAFYRVQAGAGRFSIQDNGNQRAGMVLFNDGAIRFVANGKPNFTVTGNGSLNVVGSAPGGGNMNVGLGANISPSDGNLFVKRNITYGGQLLGPSDRNIKENFQEIDPKEILEKVANLPITRWNYTTDDEKAEHIGPMAQDFKAAFQVGTSDKHINLMDSGGISLAAIKGLSQVVDAKDAKIDAQAKEIAELKAALEEQSDAIARLSEGLERLETIVAPSSK